jgi:hypothetical protein
MSALKSSLRVWLVWLAPFALLMLVILWQTDWGRAIVREPPAESGVEPQPLNVSVLPEYLPVATEASRDAVERTLFNPTRRPAPTAIADAAKPKMQRGQFALSGTLIVEGKAVAVLREVAGGKSRRVAAGDTVNGMVVAEIKPDRLRLTLGDESEELALKLATGPRTTIQPVVSPTANAPTPAATAVVAPVPARNVAEVLAERRRAARAAETAAAGLPPGAAVPAQASQTPTRSSVPPAPAVVPSNDPQWQGVYQRYQQPRR